MSMPMEIYRFVLGILCVWRITHLFHAEDGPGELIAKLRKRAGDGLWGRSMDCFYCLSLWVAVPFAIWLGGDLRELLLLWLALSAGAILIERAIDRTAVRPTYVEDREIES
jgi:hypothetical protein